MNNIILNDKKYEIVVIGMGYVGLTYSLHINAHGYNVIGVENNDNTRKLINKSMETMMVICIMVNIRNLINE